MWEFWRIAGVAKTFVKNTLKKNPTAGIWRSPSYEAMKKHRARESDNPGICLKKEKEKRFHDVNNK